ncbi:MAG TPA: substrate-binding domain-containing protein [Usitatibacter sp.]|nr:substrate-binding domain-containing protein [Usitatibacter sp.]
MASSSSSLTRISRRLRALLAALCVAACGVGAADLRLGATHTLEDSGVLAVLLPAFEAASGVKVKPLVAGTGQVVKYAENGDVDVLFTHSRADEERLVARGVALSRRDVMHNDFVIVGPRADPARIRGMKDASAALRRVREAGARFVSRGDDSGTHKKELQLWQDAGGLKPWPAYVSSGLGAARSLMMAYELDAYDLVDRATHRQLAKRHPLAILVEGDPKLLNEYGVAPIRSTPQRPANERDAQRFAAWLLSEPARKLIAGYRIDGEAVFKLR